MVQPPSIEDALSHATFVRSLALALAGPEFADDVEQDTWLVASRSRPDDPSRLRAWLGGIVRRKSAGAYRRRSRERRLDRRFEDQRPVAPSPEDLAAQEAMRRHVMDALLTLREPYRDALVLRFFEGLPPREMAVRLGIPTETARTRVKRGLALLRKRMDAQHGGRAGWVPLLTSSLNVSAASSTSSTSIAVGAVCACAVAIGGVWWWFDHNQDRVSDTARVETTAQKPDESPSPGLTGVPKGEPVSDRAHELNGHSRIAGWARRGSKQLPVRVELRRMKRESTTSHQQLAESPEVYSALARPPDRAVTSSRNGRFDFDRVPAGSYLLSTQIAERAVLVRRVSVAADGLYEDGSLSLPAGPARFTLQVEQANGGPQSFPFRIELSDQEKGDRSKGVLFGETDSQGVFTLAGVPATRAWIIIGTPGGHTRRAPIDLSQSDAHHFVMGRKGARVAGSVVDASDDTPLGEARISLSCANNSTSRMYGPNVERLGIDVDANGSFAVDTFNHDGQITISASCPGFESVTREFKEAEGELTFRLRRAPELHGRVVDRKGNPVPDVPVRIGICRSGRFASYQQKHRVVSGPDGAFRAPRTTAEGYVLVAFAYGNGWGSIELAGASPGGRNPFVVDTESTDDVLLTVERLETIAGAVVDEEGRGVQGVHVTAAPHHADRRWDDRFVRETPSTATLEDGSFVIQSVLPGTLHAVSMRGPHIVAEHALRHMKGPTHPIEAGARDVRLVTRRIRLNREIHVHVIDKDQDVPIAGVVVRPVLKTGKRGYATIAGGAVTGPEGVARLIGLPHGELGVRVYGKHLLSTSERTTWLEPSDSAIQSVNITVRTGKSIRGVVRFPPHGLQPGGIYFASVTAHQGHPHAENDTQLDVNTVPHSFVVHGLQPGRWTVSVEAHCSDGRIRKGRVEADAGDQDVQIEIPWDWKRAESKEDAEARDRVTVRMQLETPDGIRVDHATCTTWGKNGQRTSSVESEWQETYEGYGGVPPDIVSIYNFRDGSSKRMALGAVIIPAGTRKPDDNSVRVHPERVVSGTVMIGDKPAERGAQIEARPLVSRDGEEVEFPIAHGHTYVGKQGAFRIEGLGPYRYALHVKGTSGIAPDPRTVVERGTNSVTLRLRAAVTADIHVVDDNGQPLESVVVQAVRSDRRDPFVWRDEARTLTDSKGMVTLVGLDPEATYRLHVGKQSFKSPVQSKTLRDWSPRNERIVVNRYFTASGFVRKPDGTAFPKVRITTRASSGMVTTLARSDETGRFESRKILREGVMAQVIRGAMKSKTIRLRPGDANVTFVLDPGIDFSVRLGRPVPPKGKYSMLCYKAHSADGQLVGGSNTAVSDFEPQAHKLIGQPAAARWMFLWGRLGEGKFGWLTDVRPAHGQQLTIPVVDAVPLRGRIDLTGRREDARIVVTTNVPLDNNHAKIAEDGTFEFERVPPGPLDVYVIDYADPKHPVRGPAVRWTVGEVPVLKLPPR